MAMMTKRRLGCSLVGLLALVGVAQARQAGTFTESMLVQGTPEGKTVKTSLHVSPRGEAKWVRGPSGRGASRLARAGVLEQYVEHGKQAQRSPGGRIACFDRCVVRNAG